MTLGNKLQQLRKSKGLSQEQLANLLGVSRQAVSKWELDSTLPETENIIRISNIFDVSTDYLLKDKENISDTPVMVVHESSWDKRTTFMKKYGYYGGYILSAISLYCFLGYSLSLVSVFFMVYKIGGMEALKSINQMNIPFSVLIFYILLSMVGIIAGVVIAKRIEKKTAVYRENNTEG